MSDVFFSDFFSPVDDGCSSGSCNSQVVGLAKTSDHGDAVLHQEVLGQVGHALLSDDLKMNTIKFYTFAKIK